MFLTRVPHGFIRNLRVVLLHFGICVICLSIFSADLDFSIAMLYFGIRFGSHGVHA